MNQPPSAPARTIAAAALVGGFLLVIAIVAISLDGDRENGRAERSGAAKTKSAQGAGGSSRRAPKSYVVQNGDTLTSIGRKTGVSVARIQELNPGVDPQILVSGEKLKLR